MNECKDFEILKKLTCRIITIDLGISSDLLIFKIKEINFIRNIISERDKIIVGIAKCFQHYGQV